MPVTKGEKQDKEAVEEREWTETLDSACGRHFKDCADSLCSTYMDIVKILFNMPALINIKEMQHNFF